MQSTVPLLYARGGYRALSSASSSYITGDCLPLVAFRLAGRDQDPIDGRGTNGPERHRPFDAINWKLTTKWITGAVFDDERDFTASETRSYG